MYFIRVNWLQGKYASRFQLYAFIPHFTVIAVWFVRYEIRPFDLNATSRGFLFQLNFRPTAIHGKFIVVSVARQCSVLNALYAN